MISPQNIIKLDSKDKRILKQLQDNCRQTHAEIGKKTHLPRDVVAYRIKKMEDNRVIRKHLSVVNPFVLGYNMFVFVNIACFNIKLEEEEKLVNYLTSHEQISIVAKISGKYDYSIGICAKDYEDFDSIVKDIRRKFGSVVKDIEYYPIIRAYKYGQALESSTTF